MGSSCSSANLATAPSVPHASTATPPQRGGDAYNLPLHPSSHRTINPLSVEASATTGQPNADACHPHHLSTVTSNADLSRRDVGHFLSEPTSPQSSLAPIGSAFFSIQSDGSSNSAAQMEAHRSLDPPPLPRPTGVVRILPGDDNHRQPSVASGIGSVFPGSQLVSPKNNNEDVRSIEAPRSMIVELAMFQPMNLHKEPNEDMMMSNGSRARSTSFGLVDNNAPPSPTEGNAGSFVSQGIPSSWQYALPAPNTAAVHSIPSTPNSMSQPLTPTHIPPPSSFSDVNNEVLLTPLSTFSL